MKKSKLRGEVEAMAQEKNLKWFQTVDHLFCLGSGGLTHSPSDPLSLFERQQEQKSSHFQEGWIDHLSPQEILDLLDWLTPYKDSLLEYQRELDAFFEERAEEIKEVLYEWELFGQTSFSLLAQDILSAVIHLHQSNPSSITALWYTKISTLHALEAQAHLVAFLRSFVRK